MKRRKYLVYGVILILLVISTSVVVLSLEKPPMAQITEARQKLAEARKAGLSGFESDLFLRAVDQYDSAMVLWNSENERLFLLRDYEEVRNHAERAGELAADAISETHESIRNAGKELEIRIPSLERRLRLFQTRYGQFPYEKHDMEELTRAKLLFTEGVMAYKALDFSSSTRKIDQVEATLLRLYERYELIESQYFRQYPLWERWVEESLEKSRKEKAACVIIDKYSRSCLLYKNGKLHKSYIAELGPNWIGDKNLQGDRTTPEGQYRVISKKSNGQTKYHKAFLLDYPNQDDKARFQQNKKNGTIHFEARIGSSIEIHGSGGKGTDWTDGCIALKDKDMDELFSACVTGTRVTIVGSVVPLEIIDKRFKD